MKRNLLLVVTIFLATLGVKATDLWSGQKHVSWDEGGVQIEASQFAQAVAGQKLVVHYSNASDGIEFKVMNATFDHLAGSREAAWISGDGTFEQFLTQAAVDGLKQYGLEVIGANFNITKLELLDGKDLKEGITIWTGFFWADDWSTLELYRDGYSYVDFSKVESLRVYSEAGRTDYVLNIRSSWEEDGFIADKAMMTDGEGYAELILTDDLRQKIANSSHLMIQFNKESGNPFNATDIVLVELSQEPSNVENINGQNAAKKLVIDGQIYIMHNNQLYNVLGAQVR